MRKWSTAPNKKSIIKDTYFVFCPKYHKKTEVDVFFKEYQNPKDIIPSKTHSGTKCHLFPDGSCPLIDAPCLRGMF